MILYPNIKINLGLHVVRKRPDGYHDLETIFVPVKWSDVLEIIPSSDKKLEFSQSGLQIESSLDDNLCVKAWKLLNNEFGIPEVKMHLHKLIPTGAGLGGGSSDAAFTLMGLNSLFHLKLSNEKLIELSLQLGSDCPFFIENIPVVAKGRGEIMSPVNLNLTGLYIYIIKPPVHVSTAEAFSGMVPNAENRDLTSLLQMPVSEWKHWVKNDFEKTIFNKHPEIEKLKNKMYEKGALYASMSGSGASVYGLFDSKPESFSEEGEIEFIGSL